MDPVDIYFIRIEALILDKVRMHEAGSNDIWEALLEEYKRVMAIASPRIKCDIWSHLV